MVDRPRAPSARRLTRGRNGRDRRAARPGTARVGRRAVRRGRPEVPGPSVPPPPLRAGPGRPSLHAFALDDGVPVGHAAVVPTPARRGNATLRAGKLEALVVAESHRGSRRRRARGPPGARRPLRTRRRARVRAAPRVRHAASRPSHPIRARRRRGLAVPRRTVEDLAVRAAAAAERALAAAQHGLRSRRGRGSPSEVRLRPCAPVTADDAGLLATPVLPDGRWAVVAEGAWDWYASSPYVRVLESGDGSRALVQLPGWPREPLRVAAWDSPSPGLRSAVVLLDAAARLAREHGAATLRLQIARQTPACAVQPALSASSSGAT